MTILVYEGLHFPLSDQSDIAVMIVNATKSLFLTKEYIWAKVFKNEPSKTF